MSCLTKGQQEQGPWSATISVSSGGPQTQAAGEIYFATPLDEASRESMKVRYMNEVEVLTPTEHEECVGSAAEPFAAEGWLCIYQGATANFGSLKTEWKEAHFFAVENGFGESCLPAAGLESGVLTCTGTKNFQLGGFVVFRTKTFKEPPTTIPAAAQLTAMGTWAVRAK
jgi:hypothetical protein